MSSIELFVKYRINIKTNMQIYLLLLLDKSNRNIDGIKIEVKESAKKIENATFIL